MSLCTRKAACTIVRSNRILFVQVAEFVSVCPLRESYKSAPPASPLPTKRCIAFSIQPKLFGQNLRLCGAVVRFWSCVDNRGSRDRDYKPAFFPY
jgi:hypothetical protein